MGSGGGRSRAVDGELPGARRLGVRAISRPGLGGLLRIRFEPGSESLVLPLPRPSLLRLRTPVYADGPDWAEVRWDIEGGLLVASVGRHRGSLRIRLMRPSPRRRCRRRKRSPVGAHGGGGLLPPDPRRRRVRLGPDLALRADAGANSHPRHARVPALHAPSSSCHRARPIPPWPSPEEVCEEVGRRALVSGATGFVGGRLAAALGDLGWEVVCLVRDRSRSRHLADRGFELHEADVLDPRTLRGAGRGMEVAYYLIHSMGRGARGRLRGARAAERPEFRGDGAARRGVPGRLPRRPR